MSDLLQQAIDHYQNGRYEQAIPPAEEAARQVKEIMGENNLFYMALLTIQASSYAKIFQYLRAESIYLRLKALLALDKSDEGYASCLNNLASMYSEMGLYTQAEILLLESLALTKAAKGENDSTYTFGLNNLAAVYHSMGQYNKSEPLYRQAIEVRKKVYGPAHPSYALSLNNLGTLYMEMGQVEKAEPLFLQAIGIWRKAKGEMNADYAMGINNMAALYEEKGEWAKAETHYRISLNIRQQVFGEKHPEYAMSLNNLAAVSVKLKKFAEAENLMKQAADTWKQVYGDRHPNYALALNNLGALFRKSGARYREAENYYLQSIALRRQVLGENHPLTADTENDLALLYLQMKQPERATPLLLGSSRKIVANLLGNFSILSDKEKSRYLEHQYLVLESNLALLHEPGPHSPEMLSHCYNLLLVFKSLSLSDTRNLLSRIRNSRDSMIRRMFSEWQSTRLVIAHQYSLPAAQRLEELSTLEAKAEQIEKELNRRSSDFRNQQGALQVSMKQVQEKMFADEAAVEFVRYRPYQNGWNDTAWYGAFILRKQDKAPLFVKLCSEAQLDAVAAGAARSPTLFAKTAYRALGPGAGALLGDNLYALIWKPLEKHLLGVQRISYSPAGKLFGIAFHALPVDPGALLLDRHRLQQYMSTRQLAFRTSEVGRTQAGHIVLFGNSLFTMDSIQLSQRRTQEVLTHATVAMRSGENGAWQELPGTGEEVSRIASIFSTKKIPAQVHTGSNASEENIKSLSGRAPRIIHIATHGFFLDAKQDAGSPGNAYSFSRDPLMRSGLALAGANYVWGGKDPLPGVEDGIATAYEISQLDLSNTDLVVLSACETGLGDVKGSEGVFGLQRSFKMAGVKSMVVSLWQVPDKETVELMTAFYTQRMLGKGTLESFHFAQTEMRKKYPPFFWAAFVLVE